MKTIFITGASSGIGRETTKYFAAQGWRVIATMRNLKKAGDLETLPNVTIMPLDVTGTEQIHQTCRKALAQYDINVLLNNADYGIMAPFERIPEDEICKLFETDVFGTMFVTQEFIPYFKARRSGAILTTTSLAAIIGLPSDGAYGAANQRKYLLAGNAEFPDATEAAKIIFEAATDGKDQINYPTNSVCKKLYEQYQSMGLESFKIYFGRLLYEEVT